MIPPSRMLPNVPDPISTVIEAVGSLVCVVDRKGRIVRFNRACEELTGWSAAEVQGRRFFDFLLVPDEVERVKAVMAGVEAGGFPDRSENYWVTRSGELRLISWRNDALLDADGTVLNVIGTGVDTTDEKRLERELREAERRYRGLVEQLPAILYTAELGLDGGWHYTSPQIEATPGFTTEEWAADSGLWFSRIHPGDQERVRAYEESGFQPGDPYLVEYRMLARDGRVVWLRDEASIVRDNASGRLLTHGFLFDITDRKEAEQKLREAEERYRILVEQLPLAVYLDEIDPEAPWIYLSPQIEAMLGYPVDEWLSKPETFFSVMHAEDRERVRAELQRTVETGCPFTSEYRMIGRDGSVVWVHDRGSPLPDAEGTRRHLQGFMLDITDRKEVEDELMTANRKLQAYIESSPLATLERGRGDRPSCPLGVGGDGGGFHVVGRARLPGRLLERP